jgi:hypothetical protein
MRKGMKGVITLHPLNKYLISCQSRTIFGDVNVKNIFTSHIEVFIEGIEYDQTFHTFSHCNLTV